MKESKNEAHILWASYTYYKFKREQNNSHCLLLKMAKQTNKQKNARVYLHIFTFAAFLIHRCGTIDEALRIFQ